MTRVYFPDEIDANFVDLVLFSIEDPTLRDSLIACEEAGVLRFDIHLQGENQTAFFKFADR